MRRKLLVLAALSLPGCALYSGLNDNITVDEFREMVDRAPYAMPADVTVLTGPEILERIVGNTLVGPSPGNGPESAEYLHPDGAITALWRDRLSSGMWSVSRSLLCLYYPLIYLRPNWPPRDESLYHCFTVMLDGDTVSYYDQNGRAVAATSSLLAGNARNLPLDTD